MIVEFIPGLAFFFLFPLLLLLFIYLGYVIVTEEGTRTSIAQRLGAVLTGLLLCALVIAADLSARDPVQQGPTAPGLLESLAWIVSGILAFGLMLWCLFLIVTLLENEVFGISIWLILYGFFVPVISYYLISLTQYRYQFSYGIIGFVLTLISILLFTRKGGFIVKAEK